MRQLLSEEKLTALGSEIPASPTQLTPVSGIAQDWLETSGHIRRSKNSKSLRHIQQWLWPLRDRHSSHKRDLSSKQIEARWAFFKNRNEQITLSLMTDLTQMHQAR